MGPAGVLPAAVCCFAAKALFTNLPVAPFAAQQWSRDLHVVERMAALAFHRLVATFTHLDPLGPILRAINLHLNLVATRAYLWRPD